MRAVEQFGELGSLESAKAVFEIISPVSGTVTAVNPAVIDNPGLINEDPYGAGWLVEMKLTSLAARSGIAAGSGGICRNRQAQSGGGIRGTVEWETSL